MTLPKIYTLPRLNAPGKKSRSRSDRGAKLRTDLLMITKVAGLELGPNVQPMLDATLDGLIRQKVQLTHFKGDLAKTLRFDVQAETSTETTSPRHVVVIGIGGVEAFDHQAACKVFGEFIDEAFRLGVEHGTVVFHPKRATGASLNLKGTAHILKVVVAQKFAALKEPVALKEIAVLCTPQAERHIKAGLEAPIRHSAACTCSAAAK